MAAVKRRRYEMANRARQAAETRRGIVDAAARLFLRHGYAATSINAIAAEAEVSLPESARWREMELEADPRQKLAKFVRLHREICEREAGLFVVLEMAAAVDAEIEPLLRDKERFRYEDQRRVARSLGRQGELRAGVSIRNAADIIWALASERVYLALVQERGWSVKQYEAWLTDQLVG